MMRHLFVLGMGALFYYLYAHPFSVWFWTQWGGPQAVPRSDFQAGIWMVCVGMAAGQLVAGLLLPACRALLFPITMLFGRGHGRAFWGTAFGRRVFGMMAGGMLRLVAVSVIVGPVAWLAWSAPGWMGSTAMPAFRSAMARLPSISMPSLSMPSLPSWSSAPPALSPPAAPRQIAKAAPAPTPAPVYEPPVPIPPPFVPSWKLAPPVAAPASSSWVPSFLSPTLLFALAAVVFAFWLVSGEALNGVKYAIGRRTRPMRLTLHAMRFGFGGSARFGGLLEDWCYPWRPGLIPLGTSIYDPNWKIGIDDDRHHLIIASSRTGKGTCAIVPMLLTWRGSVFVIDVKGENAAITAEARRAMGQDVRIVDPMGVLLSVGIEDQVSRFNFLADLDPYSPNISEDIGVITDGLVPSKPGSTEDENFWDGQSKLILTGLIGHAITWPDLEPHQRSLVQVHKWIASGDMPLAEMRRNPALDGAVQNAAVAVVELSKTAGADVIGTLRGHVKWLNSRAMRGTIETSDFSLSDLKRRPTTIYLIIPPNYLSAHSRFMRLFINMAVSALMADPVKPPDDVLLILDEFYSCGQMRRVAEASSNLGGYGGRLCPVIQSVTQVQELYPKNWETFTGNAALWQVFGVNDATTARFISDRCGSHVRWRKMAGAAGEEWVPGNPTAFRTAGEVQFDTSRESGRQYVVREGGTVMHMRRTPYFKMFPAGSYRKNPFNERRTAWEQAGPAEKDWAQEAADDTKPARKAKAKPAPEAPEATQTPPPVDEKDESFKDFETVHDSVRETRH